MLNKYCGLALPVFAAALMIPLWSAAGELCCARCGCSCGCRKVCRLVCEEKKVEIVCWSCQCEDFCVPGRSTPSCRHCEEVCGSGDDTGKAGGVCTQPKRFVWTEWIPGGAKVLTKKKLMKKVVTKKVPSYKWVVEELCPNCQAACQPVNVPPGTEIPPAPPEAIR